MVPAMVPAPPHPDEGGVPDITPLPTHPPENDTNHNTILDLDKLVIDINNNSTNFFFNFLISLILCNTNRSHRVG